LHDIFRHIDAKWSENWCSVVCDSLLDRISLKGFRYAKATEGADGTPNDPVSVFLSTWWDSQDCSLEAEETHRALAVCGEGYVIAEKDEDGTANAYANQPHLCMVHYSEDDPREADFAAKWWEDGGKTYLTLYYADHFEHYVAGQVRTEITVASAFARDPEHPEDETNESGVIPVFHYRIERRTTLGELQNVIPLQNALNKLLADMMVSAEFAAFPQRYVISNAASVQGMDVNGKPVTGLSDLKAAPNTVMAIPAGDGEGQPTSAGQFDAATLENFTKALDHLASRIAIITRTPKHYILQAGDVSGEALLAMEAPLTRKAAKYCERLAVTWKHLAAYVCQLAGHSVVADDIECVWEDEHTVQPISESEMLWNLTRAGVPVEIAAKKVGWTAEEVHALTQAADEQAVADAKLADQKMKEAQKRFDQGQNAAPYAPGQPVETPPAAAQPLPASVPAPVPPKPKKGGR
jgi:hypothetical protein